MLRQLIKRVRLPGLLLALVCSCLSTQALPQLGVYRWAAPSGPANVDTYSTWLNQPDMWAEDFEAFDTWANISGPDWILNPWKTWVAAKPGRTLILSVPMLPSSPSDVSLATGATGAYNSYYQTLATRLVAKNLGNTIIRLGWEFNGGWYKWAASGKTADFIAYWQQIVTTMRAVEGAQNLKFCFNPVHGYQQFPANQAYPGDTYVDYVALDVYDESWTADTYPWPAGTSAEEIESRRATVWNELRNGVRGLNYWKNFAATHGKPFAIGEWGVNKRDDAHGGLDNAQFITNMYDFMTASGVAWAVYFDVQAGDGHHQLSPITSGTDFPLARARFLELFSGVKLQDEFTSGSTANWTPNFPAQWSIMNDAGDNAYKWTFNWTNQTGLSTAGDLNWGDYTVSAEFKITDLQSWSETHLYGRYTDANTYYRATVQDQGGTRKLLLQKRIGGTLSTLGSVSATINTNTWYHLALDLQGSTLTVYLNGVQMLQKIDSSRSIGKIALGAWKQSVQFDSVLVQ